MQVEKQIIAAEIRVGEALSKCVPIAHQIHSAIMSYNIAHVDFGHGEMNEMKVIALAKLGSLALEKSP